MKNIFAASFGALLLTGAIAAHAASTPVQANSPEVVAQTTASAATAGHGYFAALPVRPTVPTIAKVGPGRTNAINPWDVNLATQTGDGR